MYIRKVWICRRNMFCNILFVQISNFLSRLMHFLSLSFFCSEKLLYFWQRIIWFSVSIRFIPMRPCFSARRAFLWVHPYKKGGWVGKEARHNKGVYLTLCLRPIESRKFVFTVLNTATVDVPGVIISSRVVFVLAIIVPFGEQ